MTSDRNKRIEDLFHEAMNIDPAERDRFLVEACADDPLLLKLIKSLIKTTYETGILSTTPIVDKFAKIAARDELSSADSKTVTDPPFERLGKYKLIRRLGEGGMGVVYLAEQESLGRHVALKVIRSDRLGSPEIAARFSREARIIAGIQHPNIVTVHESGEEKGVHYFAMELLSGMGLDEKFHQTASQNKKMPIPEFLDWLHEIANALSCAHEAGVVHRDVKPSNIRITPDNKAMLMDFGIARHLDLSTLTITGEFRGTPHYASPEQIKAKGRGIDARTDIYALGVTLYEGVTGRVPFVGETTEQVFHQILEVEPIPPRRLNPALSRDLNTIIVKAMEKEPARRYQSMVELADDLHRFRKNEQISAKPAGFGTRLWKRVRRNPTLSATAGVAFLALLALIVSLPWYLVQITRERNTAEARYDEIIRLSDGKHLSQLLAEAREIWPAYPEKVPALKAWLGKADPLIQRIDRHKATLKEWRKAARKSEEGSPKESVWIFDKTEDQWKHDVLEDLVSGLAAFTNETSGTLKSVQDRLRFAQTIYGESVEKFQQEWDDVIDAISDRQRCPIYDGLLITPQVGLVPIGPDPDSGLWEFAHLQTGQVPERGKDGGILLEEDSGLVLVLIPEATFDMGAMPPTREKPLGAPNVDPEATVTEGPVHTVTVNPFFISKYEMTQGQWLRFIGNNPSRHGPQEAYGGKKHSLLHPVENVSWNDCSRVLWMLALRLPSEAEWEYVARAMTDTVWWTGNVKESLAGAVNIADLFCMNNGGEKDWNYEIWLDDGYVAHAPVNVFRPNAFGLHNTCGNVWEWCQDTLGENYDSAPTDGSPRYDKRFPYRILRGGCWNMIADYCRSAYHNWYEPASRSNTLGVRPARSIQ